MASSLQYTFRAVTGTGNPTTGDRLVREVLTFKVNTLYINRTDGSLWIRKAVNGVEADWETMESGGGSDPGYLVYSALLTQSGTNPPVATVLQNTLGGTVVWSYSSEGEYFGTLAGAFPASRTSVATTGGGSVVAAGSGRTDDDNIYVITLANNSLQEATIEVRVYPA